jgi:hypothetical protein
MEELPTELAEAFASLAGAAQGLLNQLSAANEPPIGVEKSTLQRFADISLEVSSSLPDDLRENLISAYALAARPRVSGGEIDLSPLSKLRSLRKLIVSRSYYARSEFAVLHRSVTVQGPNGGVLRLGR